LEYRKTGAYAAPVSILRIIGGRGVPMKKYLILFLLLLIIMPSAAAWAGELPPAGEYTADVALSGGSGKGQVESPARVTIEDGIPTAVVIWSSPYYQYMLINEVYYYPINTEGNATFEIPVSFDEDMDIRAQTVAMSQPHEIQYTLRFDSATLKPRSEGGTGLPVMAAVLMAVIAAGLLINLKRKKV